MQITDPEQVLGSSEERVAGTRLWRCLLGARAILRVTLFSATAGFYVLAVMEHPNPLVMAVGLAPIVWLALEAAWVLSKSK